MSLHAMRGRYFALCKELGLDDEARRALQLRVLGRESAKGATAADFHALITELERTAPAKQERPETVRRFTQRYATEKEPGRWVVVKVDRSAINQGFACACEIVERRNGLAKGALTPALRQQASKLCRAAAIRAATPKGKKTSELTRHLRPGGPAVPPAAFLIEDGDVRELSVFLRILRNQLAAVAKRAAQRGG